MPRRRTRKLQRLPQTEAFARRTIALRAMLKDDSGDAGDQAIKLLEEYLESLARSYGYYGDGSLGRYANFLRGRDALDEEVIARIDTYTQVRNCLAHSYGLQTSLDLATELVEFVELLLKGGAPTAAELMTRAVRTLAESEPLSHARDLMIRGGYGRIPVLRNGQGIVGLLIERDMVIAQVTAERGHRHFAELTVGEALPPEAGDRLAMVAPDASREQVAEALAQPGVIACLVTASGARDNAPIGIITHADLLYRM